MSEAVSESQYLLHQFWAAAAAQLLLSSFSVCSEDAAAAAGVNLVPFPLKVNLLVLRFLCYQMV